LSSSEIESSPALIRARNRKRRLRRETQRQNAARNARIFGNLVLGLTHGAIARHEYCSLRTVRQTIARELASRRIDPAEDYAKLQIERLNGALAAAHGKMLDGDMAGLDRVLKVVAELDRYHGLGRAPLSPPPLEKPPALLAGPHQRARAALPAPEASVGRRGDADFAPQALETI
jgi:hypothetical protein